VLTPQPSIATLAAVLAAVPWQPGVPAANSRSPGRRAGRGPADLGSVSRPWRPGRGRVPGVATAGTYAVRSRHHWP